MGDVHELPTAPAVPEEWERDSRGYCRYIESERDFLTVRPIGNGQWRTHVWSWDDGEWQSLVGSLVYACAMAERYACCAYVGARVPGVWGKS